MAVDLADQIRDNLRHALELQTLLAISVDGARLNDPQSIWDDLDVWAVPLLGGNLSKAQIDNGPWLVFPSYASGSASHTPIPPDNDLDFAAARMADAMRNALDQGDETGGGQLGPSRTASRTLDATQIVLDRFIAEHVKASPIIWALPEGTERRIFRRHLRHLNRARLARRPRPRHPNVSGEDEVNFRHADGIVLAALIPLLRPNQIAQILGPAIAALVVAAKAGPGTAPRVLQIVKPVAPPTESEQDTTAMLTLDAAQVDALEDSRAALLDAQIADALAATDARVADLSPLARTASVRDLRRHVYATTTFRADAHVKDLIELMWYRGPNILQNPRVAAVLSRQGWSQERKCTHLRAILLSPERTFG